MSRRGHPAHKYIDKYPFPFGINQKHVYTGKTINIGESIWTKPSITMYDGKNTEMQSTYMQLTARADPPDYLLIKVGFLTLTKAIFIWKKSRKYMYSSILIRAKP